MVFKGGGEIGLGLMNRAVKTDAIRVMSSRTVGTDSFSLDLKNKKARKAGSQHLVGFY